MLKEKINLIKLDILKFGRKRGLRFNIWWYPRHKNSHLLQSLSSVNIFHQIEFFFYASKQRITFSTLIVVTYLF